jgi:hypothetical protein
MSRNMDARASRDQPRSAPARLCGRIGKRQSSAPRSATARPAAGRWSVPSVRSRLVMFPAAERSGSRMSLADIVPERRELMHDRFGLGGRDCLESRFRARSRRRRPIYSPSASRAPPATHSTSSGRRPAELRLRRSRPRWTTFISYALAADESATARGARPVGPGLLVQCGRSRPRGCSRPLRRRSDRSARRRRGTPTPQPAGGRGGRSAPC